MEIKIHLSIVKSNKKSNASIKFYMHGGKNSEIQNTY